MQDTARDVDVRLAELRAEREQLLALLAQPADSRGECDDCHRDHRHLWTDDENPGGFQYCRTCLIRTIAKLAGRIFKLAGPTSASRGRDSALPQRITGSNERNIG